MSTPKLENLFATILLLLFSSSSAFGETLGQVIDRMNQIHYMRESLAAGLNQSKDPITETTFKNVCAPVGQSLMTWAKAEGHEIRQLSDKYRNAKNKADGNALKAIEEFRRQKSRQLLVESRTIDGVVGTQIYRRIDVQQSCLHCHGTAANLPEFIKEKYPKDLANDFKIGDLRGVYSIWMKGLAPTSERAQ